MPAFNIHKEASDFKKIASVKKKGRGVFEMINFDNRPREISADKILVSHVGSGITYTNWKTFFFYLIILPLKKKQRKHWLDRELSPRPLHEVTSALLSELSRPFDAGCPKSLVSP